MVSHAKFVCVEMVLIFATVSKLRAYLAINSAIMQAVPRGNGHLSHLMDHNVFAERIMPLHNFFN